MCATDKEPIKQRVKIGIRDLSESTLRQGDLSYKYRPRVDALEGIRTHQRLQSDRQEGYEAEYYVSETFEFEKLDIVLTGRADGVMLGENPPIVEEIKTGRNLAFEGDIMVKENQWLQARLYAAVLCSILDAPKWVVRLINVDLETEEEHLEERTYTRKRLRDELSEIIGGFAARLVNRTKHLQRRNDYLSDLAFPHSEFRPGQRRMAADIFRAGRDARQLMCAAPTGTGKTVGTLFPALKSLGHNQIERIFFLTAKTVGRMVAQQAMDLLDPQQDGIRCVTITAKDKICMTPGAPCDGEHCRFAKGYYERIDDALAEARRGGHLWRERIEEIATIHEVCPFEFSLDAARGADVIIGDYNYAFDPHVRLRRFFDEDSGNNMLLIDEAHNFVDRSRGMYSSDISTKRLFEAAEAARTDYKKLARQLEDAAAILNSHAEEMTEDTELINRWPHGLRTHLSLYQQAFEEQLARMDEPPSKMRDIYFDISSALRNWEISISGFEACFRTYIQRFDDRTLMRIQCVDAAPLVRLTLDHQHAAVFFSATLQPAHYYRAANGISGDEEMLSLPSPFDANNLCLQVCTHISTRYSDRSATLEALIEAIHTVTDSRKGHHMVLLPSYHYMERAVEAYTLRYPQHTLLVQERYMPEHARSVFLDELQRNDGAQLVAFAVLGGIFSEGIDLVGDRLISATIVGVGLPQFSPEREFIKEYFGEQGYDYAYTYPGFTRVQQAAGRVIRDEEDRGIVCLIDDRYQQNRYRQLFPAYWRPQYVNSTDGLNRNVTTFWEITNQAEPDTVE